MQEERLPQKGLLIQIYRDISPYLYGSIETIDKETYTSAFAQAGKLDLESWSAPFLIAKHLGDREIVYGSIPYIIGEAAKPIFRANYRRRVFEESLPSEIRSSMEVVYDANAIKHILPESEFPSWFIHRQEELVKEALLLSGIHLRNLLEIFSSKGNRLVPIYDYEGNPSGEITLNKLCNLMMHHRYWVVSDQYIHDIFSDKGELGSNGLFGSKVNHAELFRTMLAFLSEITVKDFVGVLRARLKSLTADSAPREIMFAIQNVHVISQIIGDWIMDPRFLTLQHFLFSKFTEEEESQIEAAKGQGPIKLTRHFEKPTFNIAQNLDEERLMMYITVNGNRETFDFDQSDFFSALTQAFGGYPITKLDKLIEYYDKPEIEVLA